jgi:hypothetical protein
MAAQDDSSADGPSAPPKRDEDGGQPAPGGKAGAAGAGDSTDVVFVHSPTDSGEGFNVIRHRRNRLELGELREIREGQPIVGEVVQLTRRAEHERLFDAEVLVKGPAPRKAKQRTRGGPAMVSSSAYRENWEEIFGDSSDPDADKKRLLN